ncbi:FAD-binding oxidoreductase (plasmid) [Shinella sp. PSBB067]|uniref:NAD(P)/FAD-dependent oxidoreductase n=1 Tax=Shinella sp. PSBB067 TaxID=2715959 RepID=UPI00193BA374|nr:FAD-dependent oxidoreductase [Shinella sp. PSBB067]QRI66795.1 FAD-binding oxidoreductase [Shinella sp. PSBB067]
MKGSVAIVGSGVIGTVTAIELNRIGYDVTLIDREEPGSSEAASSGNGGWLCPASIIPVSVPSLIWRLPSFLFGKSAPLSGNVGFAIRNAGHFARFVNSGLTHNRVRNKATALSSLLSDTMARHQALAKEAGLQHLIRGDGLLYTYSSERAFRRDLCWGNLRRDLGVNWTFLDGRTLRTEELGIERACFGAVLVTNAGHCIDPAGYVRGLADHARRRGTNFIKADVTRLIHSGQRLAGFETSKGMFAFDAAVICSGAHSRPLAQEIGDDPPLLGERGYHVTLRDGQRLRRPVMFDDALMVATPIVDGTRLAGQVEIATPGSPPDWSRAQALLDLAGGYLGGLPANIRQSGVSVWMGRRPAIADELPVIGRATNVENVHFAFGHGFTGLGAAPATAELVRHSLQSGRATSPKDAPFSPQRFPVRTSRAL